MKLPKEEDVETLLEDMYSNSRGREAKTLAQICMLQEERINELESEDEESIRMENGTEIRWRGKESELTGQGSITLTTEDDFLEEHEYEEEFKEDTNTDAEAIKDSTITINEGEKVTVESYEAIGEYFKERVLSIIDEHLESAETTIQQRTIMDRVRSEVEDL